MLNNVLKSLKQLSCKIRKQFDKEYYLMTKQMIDFFVRQAQLEIIEK